MQPATRCRPPRLHRPDMRRAHHPPIPRTPTRRPTPRTPQPDSPGSSTATVAIRPPVGHRPQRNLTRTAQGRAHDGAAETAGPEQSEAPRNRKRRPRPHNSSDGSTSAVPATPSAWKRRSPRPRCPPAVTPVRDHPADGRLAPQLPGISGRHRRGRPAQAAAPAQVHPRPQSDHLWTRRGHSGPPVRENTPLLAQMGVQIVVGEPAEP